MGKIRNFIYHRLFHDIKKSSILLSSAVCFLLLLLTFFSFRKLNEFDSTKVKVNVSTLLRNESSLSNSYAVAKTLVDLQTLGIFKCAMLKEVGNIERIFFDSLDSICDGEYFLDFRLEKVALQGLNGNHYVLSFVKNINAYSLIIEIFLYFFISCLAFLIPKIITRVETMNRVKLLRIEMEKNEIVTRNNQIIHDVASPISALNAVASILTNIDPEIKAVLINAIKRTENLFKDMSLKSTENFIEHVDLKKVLMEIVSEKKLLWGDTITFLVQDFASEKELFVVGSAEKMKSIFSNLINNSYEAFSGDKTKLATPNKLEIYISISENIGLNSSIVKFQDNGPGIPSHILRKVGEKGFSYGKENLIQSGAGLGIFSAIQSIKSWGGQFAIHNERNGVCAVCELLNYTGDRIDAV